MVKKLHAQNEWLLILLTKKKILICTLALFSLQSIKTRSAPRSFKTSCNVFEDDPSCDWTVHFTMNSPNQFRSLHSRLQEKVILERMCILISKWIRNLSKERARIRWEPRKETTSHRSGQRNANWAISNCQFFFILKSAKKKKVWNENFLRVLRKKSGSCENKIQ